MKLSILLVVDAVPPIADLPVLDQHYQWVPVATSSIAAFAQLSEVLRRQQPVVIVSVGSTPPSLALLPFTYRQRWLEFANLTDIDPWGLVNCYVLGTLRKREDAPPLFSFITSTYQSGDRLARPHRSLQAQTHREWEWIVWDDSPSGHEECWQRLLRYQADDIRISAYRAPQHCGFIGEMKRRAAALAQGDWLVELDHDDDLHPSLLQWCVEALSKAPDVDFICSDYVMLSEENGESQTFGDHYAYGYGANVYQWSRGRWEIMMPTPVPNPETVRHLVGLPNHVRIWRRSFYEQIGRHNPLLPVADDYDLLVRSFLHGKWLRLAAPLYYQYNNTAGNNFTYLRNSLIQHLVLQTHYWRQEELQSRLTELQLVPTSDTRVWERETYNYRHCWEVFTPGVTPETIGIVFVVGGGDIRLQIDKVLAQQDPNWRLYIVGNNSSTLPIVMSNLAQELSSATLEKISWWNLARPRGALARNYALRMLVTTPLVTYLDESWTPTTLNDLRDALDQQAYAVKDGKLLHRYEQLVHGDFSTTQEELVTRWQATTSTLSNLDSCSSPRHPATASDTVRTDASA
jgi:glycosyltransferase involved in cell wall biosynthesis